MGLCPHTLHGRGGLAESLPRKRGFLLELRLCSLLLHSSASAGLQAGQGPRAKYPLKTHLALPICTKFNSQAFQPILATLDTEPGHLATSSSSFSSPSSPLGRGPCQVCEQQSWTGPGW